MIQAVIFDLDGTLVALVCEGRPEKELVAAGAIAIYRDPADLIEHYYECPIAILQKQIILA